MKLDNELITLEIIPVSASYPVKENIDPNKVATLPNPSAIPKYIKKNKILYPKVLHHLFFTSLKLVFKELIMPFFSAKKTYGARIQYIEKIIPGIIRRIYNPTKNNVTTTQNRTKARYFPLISKNA